MAGGLSEIQQLQLDFWTAFSEFLGSSSFSPRKPAPKNWYYLPLGTGRAKIVVTMSVDQGRLECKLAIEHSAAGASPDQAVAIYSRLGRDRTAIEAELGFLDLDWGKPTPTRIYRRRRAVIEDRGAWPDAFDWLVSCAEKFKEVFGPRITQIELPAYGGTDGPAPAAGPSRRREAPRASTGRRRRRPATADPAERSRDFGIGRARDERPTVDLFQSLADQCGLVIKCGRFPDGAAWLGLYSREREPTYRYALALSWGAQSLATSVAWVLLNPSTGDTDGKPRPILTSCRHRAESWGYSGLVVVNLFAYRTRDPKRLRAPSAVGLDNDKALELVTAACPLTVAAWGNGGANWGRSAAVRSVLTDPHCLRKDGQVTTVKGEPFYPKGVRLDAETVPLP